MVSEERGQYVVVKAHCEIKMKKERMPSDLDPYRMLALKYEKVIPIDFNSEPMFPYEQLIWPRFS